MRHLFQTYFLLMLLPSLALAAPPPSHPQACARSYCVEVLATYPDYPNVITTRSDREGQDGLVIDMGRGFFVAFSAKSIVSSMEPFKTDELVWIRSGKQARSWTCLECSATGKRQAVLGIALAGIPDSYIPTLNAVDVCIWPFDRSRTGYADGRSMSLGNRVCIRGRLP